MTASPTGSAVPPQVSVVHRTDVDSESFRSPENYEVAEATQSVVFRGRQAADEQLVRMLRRSSPFSERDAVLTVCSSRAVAKAMVDLRTSTLPHLQTKLPYSGRVLRDHVEGWATETQCHDPSAEYQSSTS